MQGWAALILGLAVPTGRGACSAFPALSLSGARLGTRPPSVLETIRGMGNRLRIRPSLRMAVPIMDGAADRRRGVRRTVQSIFRPTREVPAAVRSSSSREPAAANSSIAAWGMQWAAASATVPRAMPAAAGASATPAPAGDNCNGQQADAPEPTIAAALAHDLVGLDKQIQVCFLTSCSPSAPAACPPPPVFTIRSRTARTATPCHHGTSTRCAASSRLAGSHPCFHGRP
jgi:hypothetical protein